MHNCGSLVSSQIRYLVTNITKKNFKAHCTELGQLVSLYGQDAYVYLICCLVEQIDFRDVKGLKDQLKMQLLKEEMGHLSKQPNFTSVICQAFESVDSLQDDFISLFSKCLKLALPQEILLALGLAYAAAPSVQAQGLVPINLPLVTHISTGVRYLKSKLPELTLNNTKSLPENVMHNLLYFLKTHEAFAKQKPYLMKALQKLQPSNSIALSPLTPQSPTSEDLLACDFKRDFSADSSSYLSPLLARTQAAPHPAQLMEDIGCSCCASVTVLKDLLQQFPKLKEQDIALMLGTMARTHTTEVTNMATGNQWAGAEEGAVFPLYTSFSSAHDEGKEFKDLKSWDASVFVDTIKELYPKLNWATVIKHLDHPGFLLTDQKGLALIATIYRKASKDPFPLEVLFSTLWVNTTGQLSFLKLALAAPPDVFNFATAPRRQSPIDALPARSVAPLGPPPPPAAPPNSPWYSLALIETLLKLAETEHHTALRAIFDAPIKQCPELLLLGLIQVKPTWNNVLRSELISTLMALFLGNHPNSSLVLHKLHHTAPSVVIRGMVEMYFKDPSSLSRLLDIAQDLKALNTILTARPFSFVIDLAALASHREYLYLDKWLQDRINEHGATFAAACIAYIKEKLKLQSAQPFLKGQDKSPNFPLSTEIIASFFKALHNNATILPPSVLAELTQLSPKAPAGMGNEGDVSPPPVAAVVGSGNAGLPPPGSAIGVGTPLGSAGHLMPPGGAAGPLLQPTDPRVFPHEIEEEANSYFQRIYTGQLSIEEVVTLLKGFKSSKNSRELDVFACMIHNLFDEYRFFPKYPDKELRITGILFGSLIQHQLVSFLPLGVALRYVLDALRKPAGSKMFKFGLYALEQFKPRLYEWPQYCSHILAIPQIKAHHPDIIDIIEKALSQPSPGAQQIPPENPVVVANVSVPQNSSSPPPNASRNFPPPPPGLPPLPNSQAHDAASPPAASTEFDQPTLGNTLLLKSARDIVQPDEHTKDKIHFIFNNVSQHNMELKANELRELLKEDYYDYLAQYLVVKRISIEQNFHPLYLAFLEKLNLPLLSQLILSYTLDNIKTLLRSEKLKTDISERSVLKHLGSWLGLITLAKNKPLYHRDLSPKDLLCQGYDQGTLVALVPFVAKIMEACTQSKVFKPPNPWVVAIMRLMAEIYQLPDLKLNLRFEIELLCNNLQLDLNELKPTSLLASRKLAHDDSKSQSALARPHSPDSAPVLPSQPIDFINLPTFITYNPSITLFTQQPILKRVVPVAIERAIREIIAPVVERSVTIAVITTKELVSKDFATEPDEQKMRRAAHLMVQNMAGSLALVTCKEPLRVSMANNLRPLLGNNENSLPLVEHAISVLCAENLDLACAVIEKAATDRAVREIDEALSSSLALRRKYRERLPTSGSFMDMSHLAARYALSIPDPLRPKAGTSSPHFVLQKFLINHDYRRATATPTACV
jgi:CCR4-NOT transcription complex subunit 1